MARDGREAGAIPAGMEAEVARGAAVDRARVAGTGERGPVW